MKTFLALAFALTCFVRVFAAEALPASVVPSTNPLPDFLPIGSEKAMLDWAVTNRQWSLHWKPLATVTSWTLDFAAGSVYFSSTALNVSSFDEFVTLATQRGQLLLKELVKRKDVDPLENITYVVYHGYADMVKNEGEGGLQLSKNLGPVSVINSNSFSGLHVDWKQSVVRIPNLEKVEVVVGEYPYRTKTLPVGEYVVFDDTYSTSVNRLRIKVTAGGKTATYTQLGTLITCPVVETLDDRTVHVSYTRGSDTKVYRSLDLANPKWFLFKTVNWSEGGTNQQFLIPPPSNMSFFRAMSE